MKMTKIGTLKGWWIFKCPVYVVDYELKYGKKLAAGQDVAALHEGYFWWMRIRIEKVYYEGPNGIQYLHHEHRHAVDKSHPLRFNRKDSRLEKDAREHAAKMRGKPVPWIKD